LAELPILVTQHLSTSEHTKNINLKTKSKQSFIKNTLENQNKQSYCPLDLSQTMLEFDIPLWKLNYPPFKNYLKNILVNVFLTSLQFAKIKFLQLMKILFLVKKLGMGQFGFQLSANRR